MTMSAGAAVSAALAGHTTCKKVYVLCAMARDDPSVGSAAAMFCTCGQASAGGATHARHAVAAAVDPSPTLGSWHMTGLQCSGTAAQRLHTQTDCSSTSPHLECAACLGQQRPPYERELEAARVADSALQCALRRAFEAQWRPVTCHLRVRPRELRIQLRL